MPTKELLRVAMSPAQVKLACAEWAHKQTAIRSDHVVRVVFERGETDGSIGGATVIFNATRRVQASGRNAAQPEPDQQP